MSSRIYNKNRIKLIIILDEDLLLLARKNVYNENSEYYVTDTTKFTDCITEKPYIEHFQNIHIHKPNGYEFGIQRVNQIIKEYNEKTF